MLFLLEFQDTVLECLIGASSWNFVEHHEKVCRVGLSTCCHEWIPRKSCSKKSNKWLPRGNWDILRNKQKVFLRSLSSLSLSESQRFVALGLVYRRSLLTASCTDLLNLCVVAIWITYSCRYSTGKVVGQCSYPTGSSTCSDHSSTLFLLSISHLRIHKSLLGVLWNLLSHYPGSFVHLFILLLQSHWMFPFWRSLATMRLSWNCTGAASLPCRRVCHWTAEIFHVGRNRGQ